MSEQIKQVVVVDSDVDSATNLATLITFLEYEPYVLGSHSDLAELSSSLENIVAVLVGDDPKLELLKSTVDVINMAGLDYPCYLIQNEHDGYPPLSAMLKKKVSGSLTTPISYKDILRLLHESDMLSNSRKNSKGQQSARLFRSLVGTSRDINYIRELITQVAGTEASVLILGESGTGKEVVARNIHDFSSRRKKPFVPVNCGAIPPELLESELLVTKKLRLQGLLVHGRGVLKFPMGAHCFWMK